VQYRYSEFETVTSRHVTPTAQLFRTLNRKDGAEENEEKEISVYLTIQKFLILTF
jgi:hypothetical protein